MAICNTWKTLNRLLLILSSVCFTSNYVFSLDKAVHTTTLPVTLESDLFFEVVNPEYLRYTYKIRAAKDFGGHFNQSLQNAHLVPAVPQHACSDIQNRLLIESNVVLIERGGCSFLTKAINAEQAGASAVIIMDNKENNIDQYIDMVDDGTGRKTFIPVFFLLGKNGYMIRNTLQELHLQSAIINIPVNVTGIPVHQIRQPPWSLW